MDIDHLISEFIGVLRDYRSTSKNAVAWTTLLAYEIIITLDQEINLIWTTSWSAVNVLHILVRYYSFAYLLLNTYVEINTHLSVEFCKKYFPFLIWGASIIVPTADILVIIRLYALYKRSRRVGAVLILLWLAELGCIFGFVGVSFINIKHGRNPLPGLFSACFPTTYRDILVVEGGLIALAIQVVYLSMALYVMFKRAGTLTNMAPLLSVFFRDGAMYCLILIVMYIVNILFVKLATDSPLEFVGAGWLVSIIAIATGRMVLNLRGSVIARHDDRWTDKTNIRQMETCAIELGQFSSVIHEESL